MTVSSMTGFARTDGQDQSTRWHWELRSVNGKGLDVRMRLPNGFEVLEPRLKILLGDTIKRGNVHASLNMDRSRIQPVPVVNQVVLSGILEARSDLHGRGLALVGSTAEGILGLKGVLEFADPPRDDVGREALEEALLASFGDAVEALKRVRDEEGRKLHAVLEQQISTIEELTATARSDPALRVEARRTRLQAQVQELLGMVPALSEERLAQEMAVLASRSDICEELDRLEAHASQARDLLADGVSVGRRLDFLTQEFNREANTLCSKAADISLTRTGLELKTIIDQMREQVQNVE